MRCNHPRSCMIISTHVMAYNISYDLLFLLLIHMTSISITMTTAATITTVTGRIINAIIPVKKKDKIN